MYLETYQESPFIADKDIFVYMECTVTHRNELEAFYSDIYSCAKKEEVIMKKKPYKTYDGVIKYYEVGKGLKADLNYDDKWHNTIWVIPKGSKYYVSRNEEQIAANRMNFCEFVGKESKRNFLADFGIKWQKNCFKRFFLRIINQF